MGKNRVIKIIGRIVARLVAHKILEKYTNRKESLNHLRGEVDNYRNNLSKFIHEFNWNADDLLEIKEESSKGMILELKKPQFDDVKFPIEIVDPLIEETIKEILG